MSNNKSSYKEMFSNTEIYLDSETEGWVCLPSLEEKRIFSLQEEKRKKDREEIKTLRQGGLLAQRKDLRDRINLISIPPKVLNSSLDSSLRNRLLRDTLLSRLSSWKKDISFLLAKAEICAKITSSPPPQPLKWEGSDKNLLTELNSFAFSASISAEKNGLTRNILTDIVWSVCLCLCKNFSLAVGRSLSIIELSILRECSLDLIEPLLFFWEKAVTNCGQIKERVSLPLLWEEEEKNRKEKEADESYYRNVDKIKSFLQEGIFPRGLLIDTEEFSRRKEQLETSLKFKR